MAAGRRSNGWIITAAQVCRVTIPIKKDQLSKR